MHGNAGKVQDLDVFAELCTGNGVPMRDEGQFKDIMMSKSDGRGCERMHRSNVVKLKILYLCDVPLSPVELVIGLRHSGLLTRTRGEGGSPSLRH